MRFIEKQYFEQRVVSYEEQLRSSHLDEDSLKNISVHPDSDGGAVYDMVKSMPTFIGLKQQLFEDQGGICCYCGQKLICEDYPFRTPYIVEHIIPKGIDRTMAGEYQNLLLSCCPSKSEEDARGKVPRKVRSAFFHCDKSKGEQQITNPPTHDDIETFFSYDVFGNVIPNNESAALDCRILNLNCEWLRKRRRAAIEGYIFDEENELLNDDKLKDVADAVMSRNADNQYQEFCFAIKSAICRLLE